MPELQVRTADGRTLTAAVAGDPEGAPVFLLHGTPGSRVGQLPPERRLYRLGIRVVTYDRPGYGRSDRQPGRRISDAAADVAAVADCLQLRTFGVVGRSGGCPHALACAVLLPERVTRVAALVSIAPRDAAGLNWFEGMTESNIRAYTVGERSLDLLALEIKGRVAAMREQPRLLLESLRRELPDADLAVIADAGVRSSLARAHHEAVRAGADGWIDDVVAFLRPWGFDLGAITCPVELWHGADDVFSPVAHTRWLGSRIPGAQVRVEQRAAHFKAWHVLLDVLTRAAADAPAGEALR